MPASPREAARGKPAKMAREVLPSIFAPRLHPPPAIRYRRRYRTNSITPQSA